MFRRRRKVAALVGLPRWTRQSGQWRGQSSAAAAGKAFAALLPG